MKYHITFADGVVFDSPDIESSDPMWQTESDVKHTGILRLQVDLPYNKKLILEGFEKYNFFVECIQPFSTQQAKLIAVYFCGAHQGMVIIYKIDFENKKLLKAIAKDGYEYNGTATRGWRKGIIGDSPKSGIITIQ